MFLRAVLATIVTASAPVAFASKLEVPAQYAKIQEAIDVAVSGDVIEVASGVYHENLSGFRPGVSLIGKGKVVIDATPLDGDLGTAGSGGSVAGILIAEEGVTIKNLTIRHSPPETPYVVGGIVAYAGTVTIEDVRIVHCAGYAIQVAAPAGVVHAPRIEDCTVHGLSAGVRIQADHARVRKLQSDGGSLYAVWIEGHDARVEKCRIVSCGYVGIAIQGDDGIVKNNTIEGRSYDSGKFSWLDQQTGIMTDGDQNRVVSNTVERRAIGIAARGVQPHLEKNVVNGCGYRGLLLSEVQGGHASENEVRDSGVGVLLGGTQTFVVHRNQVESCIYGYAVLDSGTSTTTGNLFSENVARRCFNDGFLVYASGNTFTTNRAEENEVDGFDVQQGAGNSFQDNLAKNNLGEGFENNGTGTVYANNVAKGNRAAFANSGTIATFQGNQPDVIVEPAVD